MYPVLAGKVVELDRPGPGQPPRYRIEIREVLDRADVTTTYRAGANTGLTAVELMSGTGISDWVLDDEHSRYMPLRGARLRLVVAADAAAVDRALAAQFPADAGAAGFVRVLS